MHNQRRIVPQFWFFDLRHADFHDDDSDCFDGVERGAGLAVPRAL
jgi:hypothetical protein